MQRRNWKKVYPNSLRQAMEFSIRHALEKRNLSVERIAELMGEASHWTLYKWLENGRMPAVKIRPFEHACGINLVTEYLAHSAGNLILPMPTGRKSEHKEINELGLFMTETTQLLYKHHDGDIDSEEVVGALTKLMESLAYQRGNVEKELQPELGL